jgi:hypothetical protein
MDPIFLEMKVFKLLVVPEPLKRYIFLYIGLENDKNLNFESIWWPGFQSQMLQMWLRLDLWTRLRPLNRNFQNWLLLNFTRAM